MDEYFLAIHDNKPAGMIALRPAGDTICEMKRLYVKPEFRGLKIGRALVERMFEEAKSMSYTHVQLDTLKDMHYARNIYKSLGFYEIAPHGNHPEECTHFLEASLHD